MELERRNCPGTVEIRENEGGNPQIVGTAAVFYDGTARTEYKIEGWFKERIMPGTFDGAMKRPDDVRGLYNHDANWLLGRNRAGTMKLSVAPDGLQYDIQAPNTEQGRTVATAIRRGDVSGSSFAFRVTEERWIDAKEADSDVDVREIRSVERIDETARLISNLERTGLLDREIEFLPDDTEILHLSPMQILCQRCQQVGPPITSKQD